MKNRFALGACALALGSAIALTACGGGDSVSPFTVAVIGDVPYGTSPTDNSEFLKNPGLIAAINQDKDIAFTMHAGDIHSGKEYCTESYDRSIYQQWSAFAKPLLYTPGDNEWADCHKVKQGGGSYDAATGQIKYVLDANGQPVSYAKGDPLENLKLVRSIFFAKPGLSLGASPMNVESQAQAYDKNNPADAAFVENTFWQKARVSFVTLNIPGGSNDDTDPWYGTPAMSDAQKAEVAARSAANLRWLDRAFARATADNDLAMVIMVQADMWDADGKNAQHLTEYKKYIDRIAALAKTFGRPVLLINGDSHVYRTDNPLRKGAPCFIEPTPGASAVTCASVAATLAKDNNPADPYDNQPGGYNVPNFRRIVVHGSTFPLEYLRLAIDPTANAGDTENAFGPFRWTRVQPAL
jgi:hypothetical protein